MKPQQQHFCHFFTLSLIASLAAQTRVTNGADLVGQKYPRRVLHQPLYPESSSPPPATIPPPPPPPVTTTPDFPSPDQPFFPEVPTGPPPPDQAQQSPPAANGTTATPTAANPIATPPQQTKPAKKVAIAISVGIVTLGMLSALAFYIYKHRLKHPDESRKLVGADSQRIIHDDSRMPPSNFLYIGTVEPSAQTSQSNGTVNGSPYRKLSSLKRSDRYRPSPDLQPLPPLTKPLPPPPAISSPQPMSSSDEESPGTAFYTPQGSSLSNEEGSYTPSSARVSQLGNGTTSHINSSVPHSKRTSPKSRRYASSNDVRPAIIPSIKQPLPPASPPPPTITYQESPRLESPPPGKLSKPVIPYAPNRPKFASPPPPPDIGRLQRISSQDQDTSKPPLPPPPLPPPPPPPPPPLLTTTQTKVGASESIIPSATSSQFMIPKSRSSSPKTSSTIEKTSPGGEFRDKGSNSSSSGRHHDGDDVDGMKPRLKPLHWDKVRAISDRATVWDQLKSSSFQLNEDMMESLFGCSISSGNSLPREAGRRSVLPPVEQENRVLDPKKSQNIAILLRALNVTLDEVSEALVDGNPEGLGPELLETLVKMAPTKEEEIKLRNYDGDTSKLGSAERFLKAILDVPFAFKRVEVMLYRANFDSEVNYLRKSFQTLEEASQELKDSRLFLKLLEAVLRTGNRMNIGTNRGDARAFKLDTLLKLVDIKGTDGKTTLLHFVVQEIIRSEGAGPEPTTKEASLKFKEEDFKKHGLQVVAGLSKELGSVRKAAAMDSDVLSSYVSKLEIGLERVRLVLQYEKPGMQGKFFSAMKNFLKEAEDEISTLKDEEKRALSSVKEVTEYFHGDAAKEEAHPLRIFVIVRDFLSVLDNVCKEVGRLQDRSMVMGTVRSFRIPATASLPVLSINNGRHDRSSDDDSSSS